MINPFFINKGPFKIDYLLTLSDISYEGSIKSDEVKNLIFNILQSLN